jgi:hypothetical protein
MTRRQILSLVILASIAFAPALAFAERWAGDGISWEVPEGWTQKQGSSEFRFAQIDLGDNLVLVVSRFGGDVGGTLANVNRWRGQLQLPPVKAEELEKVTKKIKAGEATALMTDFTSEAGDQRMLGAILSDEKGGRTWFFKLTGPAKAVGEREEKFRKFVESVKLDGAK